MGWPYEFVSLTPEQKHARREVLDWYGFVAHCSALAPVLAFGLLHLARLAYRHVTGTLRGVDGQGTYAEIPNSPAIKAQEIAAVRKLYTTWTRLRWWLGDEVRVGGASWGRREEWVLGLSWTAWLLLLCFIETGKDYFHLTKRFGIVAVSQLPIQYLLSLKAMNPFAWALASSHEEVNNYHRILGRISYGLVLVHLILYNVYYIITSKWVARIFAPVILCGVLASLLFHLIAITSMRRIREAAYRVFFITHLVGAFFAPTLLVFHAKSARWYAIECCIIFLFDLAVRRRYSTVVLATIEAIPGTTLIKITAPLPLGHLDAFRGAPGSHVYVSLPTEGRKDSVPSSQSALFDYSYNPYSVASLVEDAEAITFVVRTRRGAMSRVLTDYAAAGVAAASPDDAKVRLTIEGPYGAMARKYRSLLTSGASRVLFVAGGVGATFILPIFQAAQAELPLARLQMVWAVRAAGDATWAVPASVASGKTTLGDERIQLFLTGEAAVGPGEADGRGESGSAIEMRPLPPSRRAFGGRGGRTCLGAAEQNRRRPDFEKIVDEAFRLSAQGVVAVVVCGPKEMADEVRRCVRPWVMKGRRVWYHNESFGW
ncbi:Flavoprotein transmembrane component [Cordyceps fumosorosea ARSEF 2679]|uniref:ferric-chelate reductase (NADPH) n=1 Tax=Cordyceps fumosorosea (strain ARSEF 2679) TaxID=1081104 RepID=A0A162MH97_CORFA|nr:Flavoprotein transmembrane component [Cordyceps fumosorosea ARSEF 2679]OAA56040.1 Flavoprotein transmembrane component [Cordyceps fumosorosea ARSEF 2679]